MGTAEVWGKRVGRIKKISLPASDSRRLPCGSNWRACGYGNFEARAGSGVHGAIWRNNLMQQVQAHSLPGKAKTPIYTDRLEACRSKIRQGWARCMSRKSPKVAWCRQSKDCRVKQVLRPTPADPHDPRSCTTDTRSLTRGPPAAIVNAFRRAHLDALSLGCGAARAALGINGPRCSQIAGRGASANREFHDARDGRSWGCVC